MINILPAIFVIGVLVFIHELGHFLVAKARKVRVEKFSLGFGPEIIGCKIGDTRYVLSLIPLGGYVKMAGENLEDEGKGEPYEYRSKSVKDRLSIVASGPLMNIVLCVVILAILFNIGLPYISSQVGTILKDSPAEEVGIKSGDKILEIDGALVADWTSLTKIIRKNPNKLLKLKVERGEGELEIGIKPRLDETTKMGLIGITPYYGRKVGKILKTSSAYKAGIREGDEIIRVSGNPVSQWNEILDLMGKEKANEVSLSMLRQEVENGEESIEIHFSFTRDEQSGTPLLDFYPALPKKRFSLFISFGKAVSRTFYLVKIVYVGLWQLVTGQVSAKLIGGPILIAQLAGQEAQMGLARLFLFIAIISVNLAVLNFLPIPVLDGGHILFLLIEGIRGKPLSKRKQEIAQQIGIAILVGLMMFATYNDILRFIQK